MPMRGELFIPEGHPLYKAIFDRFVASRFRRSKPKSGDGILVVRIIVALYLAIHFSSQEQIWLELITLS
jgi:hypothetical protein